MRVNRSSYYKHFSNKPAPRALENERIKRCILELYAKSDKRLGVLKLKEMLGDYGIFISAGRVYRLMKSMKLPQMSTIKPKNLSHFNDEPLDAPNHLNKQFKQKSPDLVWVSDITYIRAANRFFYLCVIIDLFSRKVIAYKLSDKIDAVLVLDTFNIAYKHRNCPAGLMFHSDRGCQYTSKTFRQLLDKLNVVQSFSAKGHPYDNAVCESFFKYLKLEEVNRRTYATRQQLEMALFEYIEGFYNSVRPHSNNSNLAPNKMEYKYYNS